MKVLARGTALVVVGMLGVATAIAAAGGQARPTQTTTTTTTGQTTTGQTTTGGTTTGGTTTGQTTTGRTTTTETTTGAGGAAAARATRTFLVTADASDQFELLSASIVRQRAMTPEVRRYASMLLRDHARANTQLTRLARSLDVNLAKKPTRAQARQIVLLRRLTRQAVDRTFLQLQITAHRKAITLFAREAERGQNAATRAHAARQLPALRRHEQEARRLLRGSAR